MVTSALPLEERLNARALPAVVDDVLAIFLLVTVGVIQHNGVSYPLTDPVSQVFTTVSLLIGQLFTVPLLGAYSSGAAESAKLAVPFGVRPWFAVAAVGMAICWTPLFGDGVELTFIVVMLVFSPVALGVWWMLYFKLV